MYRAALLKPLKLLVTARDPSSGNDICSLLSKLPVGHSVIVAAQDPAFEILARYINNLPPTTSCYFELLDLRTKPFREYIDSVILHFSPSIIITGVSSLGSGVDEYALWAAKQSLDLPTFAIQSYWGDVNTSLGVLPDYMFVLDNYAMNLTHKLYPSIKCFVSGPFQSTQYSSFSSSSERRKFRLNKNVRDHALAFFGQPLFEFDWYKETLASFFSQCSVVARSYPIFYRPHPKESDTSIRWTSEAISSYFDNFQVETTSNLFQLLSGVDLSISVSSTTGYDLQQLNQYSSSTLSVPMYLAFHPGMREWLRTQCAMESLPLSEKPLALTINEPSQVSQSINLALTNSFRLQHWQSVKDLLSAAEPLSHAKLQDYLYSSLN